MHIHAHQNAISALRWQFNDLFKFSSVLHFPKPLHWAYIFLSLYIYKWKITIF